MEPVTKICPSNKACFDTEAAAQQFADSHARINGAQRAYDCPKCAYYHLTSEVENSRAFAASSIYRTEVPVTNQPSVAGQCEEKRAEIIALYNGGAGLGITAISEKLGLPYANLREYMIRRGIHTPTSTAVPTLKRAKSVDDCDDVEQQVLNQIAALQAQLAAVKAKRDEVIAESRLKIFWGAPMLGDESAALIVIQKRKEMMRLTVEDVEELAIGLTAWLAENVGTAVSR
jgi:hypothetical protein